ncbi:topB, partial [Symbiodinium microadriaticum]
VLQITAERFLASFLPPATGLGDRHGDADVVFKATAVALAPSHGYHRSREAESLVLVEDTVARLLERVVAMGNAKYSEAKRKTQVEDYVFDTKESILLDPGYLAAEGKKADRKELSAPLPKGTIVYLHEKPKVESKATKPPARFTKASLLKAMETCYNLVSKDLREAMKGGIGTAATRADIIDKLCLQKWLDEQSNKTLVATPEAIQLVDRMRTQPLMRELSTVELTGQWELRLKQIEEGRANKKRYDAELKSAVERIVVCGLLGPP